jgi:hypothetical protein
MASLIAAAVFGRRYSTCSYLQSHGTPSLTNDQGIAPTMPLHSILYHKRQARSRAVGSSLPHAKLRCLETGAHRVSVRKDFSSGQAVELLIVFKVRLSVRLRRRCLIICPIALSNSSPVCIGVLCSEKQASLPDANLSRRRRQTTESTTSVYLDQKSRRISYSRCTVGVYCTSIAMIVASHIACGVYALNGR